MTTEALAPLGRVVATERKPNTPHEFHFWTSLDSPVGVGTIVRVEGKYTINGQITRVYGVVVEGFSYSDLQSPLHDVLGHDGSPAGASLASTERVPKLPPPRRTVAASPLSVGRVTTLITPPSAVSP